MDFILASGSPRRKEILETIGMEFSIIESDTDETAAEGMAPGETVRLLSGEKARAVAEKVSRDAVIIGADTIVYMDGEIFGKPGGEKDARRMLSSLSGRCDKGRKKRKDGFRGGFREGMVQSAFRRGDIRLYSVRRALRKSRGVRGPGEGQPFRAPDRGGLFYGSGAFSGCAWKAFF